MQQKIAETAIITAFVCRHLPVKGCVLYGRNSTMTKIGNTYSYTIAMYSRCASYSDSGRAAKCIASAPCSAPSPEPSGNVSRKICMEAYFGFHILPC